MVSLTSVREDTIVRTSLFTIYDLLAHCLTTSYIGRNLAFPSDRDRLRITGRSSTVKLLLWKEWSGEQCTRSTAHRLNAF